MKKYISLVMSLFLIFMFLMSAFVDDISANERKYTDKENIIEICGNFIEKIISNDENTAWTREISIDNIVETYDIDGKY